MPTRSVEELRKRAEYMRMWRKKNPQKYLASKRRYRQKLRYEVLMHYGGKCACCGETELAFLTIDHIDGGGRKHREKLGGSGIILYRWLKKQGYPEGYQVLCYNCNCAKGHQGYCPHEVN